MAAKDMKAAPETGSKEPVQDFNKAVAEAVAKATAGMREDILEQLQAARGPAPAAIAGDKAFADALAMAIAGLTDQGTSRKRVAPHVLQQRTDAAARMMKLIVAARAQGLEPTYELRNKCYLDEVMVEPIWIDPASKEQRATVIIWGAVPNEVMVPVNEIAKEIHAAFKDSIGNVDDAPIQPAILGVTAGGLVIKSGSKAVRSITAFNDKPQDKQVTEGGLKIPHRDKPGQFVEKRILGTVAPPARQTA